MSEFAKPPRPGQRPTEDRKKKKAPAPQPKKSKERVWIACRATPGCEGKHATKSFSRPLPRGGQVHRYKCTTCGGAFHISV